MFDVQVGFLSPTTSFLSSTVLVNIRIEGMGFIFGLDKGMDAILSVPPCCLSKPTTTQACFICEVVYF